MNERDARDGGGGGAKAGKVILLGAVAMAYGALATVAVVVMAAVLAGQPPAADAPEVRAWRTPEAQWLLWASFVESAFLTVAGVGISRTREWARTLFFALAIFRFAAFAYALAQGALVGSPVALAVGLARDLAVYGGGAWLLSRPEVAALFERGDDA